jgi:DNA polymerase-1
VLGELVGVALAQAGRIVYVPIDESIPAPLIELLTDPARPIIGHATKDAAVALARHGVSIANVVGDSECASHLTEPSNWAPHDLTVVARFALRRALPEDDAVRGVGKRRKRWAAVSVAKAAAHAGSIADAAAKTWHELAPEVAPELMSEYLALSDTVGRMELVGIAVDRDDLERAGEDFVRIAGELEQEIFGLAGKELNLGSTKQLGAVLFEDLGLPVVKKTKTGWSTATEALERIEHAHPIVSLVIRWRRVRRLMDSWVTSLGKAISDDGRVHSTFHPARSFSGRLVNSNPDLGRVPGRTPEMARIRHAFAAPEGSVLLSVDYSQLGLFVLAHLTRDPALVEPLSQRGDIHVLTAAAVLDKSPDDIDDDDRQLGKIINFATFAGQGASSLALQLGVSAKEAKQFIARFDDRYSVVRAFQDEQLRLAEERGYIETIAGRRWPIGQLRSPDQMLRAYAVRMARRATHEGSVADVSRRGLLRADQALRAANLRAVPLLQVHDEVLFEVPKDELPEVARVAADAMRNAFDLEVPLRVGCKAGPNWAELEPLDG